MHGAIEVQGKDGDLFKVNDQRLKPYLGDTEEKVNTSIFLTSA